MTVQPKLPPPRKRTVTALPVPERPNPTYVEPDPPQWTMDLLLGLGVVASGIVILLVILFAAAFPWVAVSLIALFIGSWLVGLSIRLIRSRR